MKLYIISSLSCVVVVLYAHTGWAPYCAGHLNKQMNESVSQSINQDILIYAGRPLSIYSILIMGLNDTMTP